MGHCVTLMGYNGMFLVAVQHYPCLTCQSDLWHGVEASSVFGSGGFQGTYQDSWFKSGTKLHGYHGNHRSASFNFCPMHVVFHMLNLVLSAGQIDGNLDANIIHIPSLWSYNFLIVALLQQE